MLIMAMALALQTFPPITPVDVGGAIRQYQEQQRIQIQRQNAETYADQTETFSANAKEQSSAEELRTAQNVLVGRLIAEGNCSDARRVALGEGRFDLVDRVTSLCTSAAAPPQ